MYEKMFFIGGFYRTGSTLLSSILCQNPNIHIEGKSALCQLLWDGQAILDNEWTSQCLKSNNKEYLKSDLLCKIPKIYYEKCNKKIVFDKNPLWTHPGNIEVIKQNIDSNFKMIVLYRDLNEIVSSYANILVKNNFNLENPIINNFPELYSQSEGFFYAIENNQNNNFLFIDYESILDNAKNVIDSIYHFCNLEKYNHNLSNIKKYYLNKNSFFEIEGLYEVRKTINKRKIDFELDKETIDFCNFINQKIKKYKKDGVL